MFASVFYIMGRAGGLSEVCHKCYLCTVNINMQSNNREINAGSLHIKLLECGIRYRWIAHQCK